MGASYRVNHFTAITFVVISNILYGFCTFVNVMWSGISRILLYFLFSVNEIISAGQPTGNRHVRKLKWRKSMTPYEKPQ